MKINTHYYKGEDIYSDGDIESEWLKLLQEGKSKEDILMQIENFATFYHFSPVRENILSWYPFNPDDDILEIGSGCGALSSLLACKGKSLTCIDLSLKRSYINMERNKNIENATIYVGNFIDIEHDKKYDIITLIGVFEYVGKYCGENPYVHFLEDVRKLLKPNGKLLMAIENRFGLKYFAGAMEDHLSKQFDGLEGYGEGGVRTFGKEELSSLLREAGFPSLMFYYPFPDYKFPRQIFSEAHPEYFPLLDNHFPNIHYKQNLFNEYSVLQSIIEENKFDFFANSFFIKAGW